MQTRKTSEIAIVVAAVVLGLSLAGCFRYAHKARIPFENTASVAGIERVTVSTRNGGISVAEHDNSLEADIRGYAVARGSTPEEAEEWARKIEISAERSSDDDALLVISATFPQGGSSRSLAASFEIRLPRAMNVALETRNGAIRVDKRKGRVVVTTRNGSVDVADVEGPVNAKTSNGRIDVRSVTGDVDLHTSNGKVSATRLGGNVRVKTSNGAVEVQAIALRENPNVSIESSNGSVNVEMPSAVEAVLSMKTSNGSIRTDLRGADVDVLESGKRRFRARLNGGGGTVRLVTSNASVSCRLTNAQ